MLRAPVMAVCLALASLFPASAEPGPQPPCAGQAVPRIPNKGASPEIHLWGRGDLSDDWRAPGCLGWTDDAVELVVVLSARFETDRSVEDLLGHFGAVSASEGVRYWSVTDAAWKVLIEEVFALNAAEISERRADFAPDEMKTGEALYFAQKDNRATRPVIYRMQVLESGADSFTIAMENVTPVRYHILTLFGPGDLRSTHTIERLGENEWGFYSLGGVAREPLLGIGGSHASYANRAVALYRHLAGIPTDQEPPFAR